MAIHFGGMRGDERIAWPPDSNWFVAIPSGVGMFWSDAIHEDFVDSAESGFGNPSAPYQCCSLATRSKGIGTLPDSFPAIYGKSGFICLKDVDEPDIRTFDVGVPNGVVHTEEIANSVGLRWGVERGLIVLESGHRLANLRFEGCVLAALVGIDEVSRWEWIWLKERLTFILDQRSVGIG